ncbi:uncharacterized protein DFL_002456 [Arthrobotrys flagrans]|uniref:CFEM domain-containing protein n=1 Tax=Arthrobotrys flagrans TaxID=97331 RepID=A0A437AAY6_ARTFL|nr:hypothetical protein DFL_002456 [Arthrobotrys flagrans]
MKFSAIAVATVVAVVSAQGIADIPACAQTCLLPALQATGCSLTDFACSCSNEQFVSDSTDCIEDACSAADVAKAAKATYELCKSAGVEIETRAPAGPTTAAPEPEPTTAEPEPTTAEPEPTTAEPEPTTSEEPAPSSSADPTYGEPEPSTTAAETTSYAPIPTTIVSTTAAGNATQTQPPPPPSTGAAVAVAGNVVLALGGAVAAFFL